MGDKVIFEHLRVYSETKETAQKLGKKYGVPIAHLTEKIFSFISENTLNPFEPYDKKGTSAIKAIELQLDKFRMHQFKKLNEFEALYFSPILVRVTEILELLADKQYAHLSNKIHTAKAEASEAKQEAGGLSSDKQRIYELEQEGGKLKGILNEVAENIVVENLPGGKKRFSLNMDQARIDDIKRLFV